MALPVSFFSELAVVLFTALFSRPAQSASVVGPVCPANEQFRSCGTCDPTCSNPSPICIQKCTPGCYCRNGLVRYSAAGKCVSPRLCSVKFLPGKNFPSNRFEEFGFRFSDRSVSFSKFSFHQNLNSYLSCGMSLKVSWQKWGRCPSVRSEFHKFSVLWALVWGRRAPSIHTQSVCRTIVVDVTPTFTSTVKRWTAAEEQ